MSKIGIIFYFIFNTRVNFIPLFVLVEREIQIPVYDVIESGPIKLTS